MKYRLEIVQAIRKSLTAELNTMQMEGVDIEDFVYSMLLQADICLIQAIEALRGDEEDE